MSRNGAAARLLLAVTAALYGATNLDAQLPTGRIDGVVTDSVHSRPLTGALVFVTPIGTKRGSIRSAVADAVGRYVVDSLAAGGYSVDFTHPFADSLALDVPPVAVTLAHGGIAHADLGIPSSRSLIAALCPGPSLAEGRGVLVGQITRPEDETPLQGASIIAAWTELPTYRDITNLYMAQTGRVFVNAAGEYRYCDLPTDTWLDLQVQSDGRAGSVIRGIIPDSAGIAVVNLSFSSTASYRIVAVDSTVAADTALQPLLEGTATIAGRVIGPEGRPLADAQVRLADAAGAVRTDSSGRFTLTGLPPGTQSLEVRRLGYGVSQVPVGLRNGQEVSLTIELGRIIMLDSVRVVAERARYGDFEVRARRGLGRFMREGEIRASGVAEVAALARMIPGFRVQGSGVDARVYSTRRLDYLGGNCAANVVIDGNQNLEPGLVNPVEVAAIEFYATSMGAPGNFKSDCGLVLIWTKKRRGVELTSPP
ncbi:MAG: carboxypeptidase-like regulatory domain-containing protein [Gemmatimonadaceae bacterium]